MSEKFSRGSTPWLKRLRASVTTSTLPVRSPLPKSVPSTRSAPAITPRSAAATAVQRGSGVVEMDERARSTAQRLERALDQLGPRLREHLDDHVVGDQILLDDLAHEVEVRQRGRGKAHLDLLEAALDQEVEHPPL